jgi:hypothetical protein
MNTENEARKLWCPMVRFARSEDSGTFNRGRNANALNDHEQNDGALCNCIANQCAMWRWNKIPTRKYLRAMNRAALTVDEAGSPLFGQNTTGFEFVPYNIEDDPHEDPAHWRETEESANARRTGWCGLAGKP